MFCRRTELSDVANERGLIRSMLPRPDTAMIALLNDDRASAVLTHMQDVIAR
jgi:hypothetical protein